MKTTITFSAFCDAFVSMGRNNQFSYDAKRALFDYIEQYEEDTGEEMELDVIALCCDYYESDVEELINNYNIDVSEANGDEDEVSDIVEEYLQDNTCLVAKLDNGRSGATTFVYAAF